MIVLPRKEYTRPRGPSTWKEMKQRNKEEATGWNTYMALSVLYDLAEKFESEDISGTWNSNKKIINSENVFQTCRFKKSIRCFRFVNKVDDYKLAMDHDKVWFSKVTSKKWQCNVLNEI